MRRSAQKRDKPHFVLQNVWLPAIATFKNLSFVKIEQQTDEIPTLKFFLNF